MLIDIQKVVVNDRIRKDFGDIAELAADIAENGLINPPVVSPEMVLIAGERRLRACKHLGWQQIEVRIISVKDYEHQLKIEISENQKRKNFTFSEGLEWARRLEQVEKLKARERMSEGAKGTQKFAEPVGESAAVVANETGFGNKETYRQAKYIADHADAETIAKLDAEETSIHAEYVRLKAKFADAAKLAQDQAADITKLKKDLDDAKIAQKMLADLKKPDTVTVEKRVEVIPPDYETTKQKLKEAMSKIDKLTDEQLGQAQAVFQQGKRAEIRSRLSMLAKDVGKHVKELELLVRILPGDESVSSDLTEIANILRDTADAVEQMESGVTIDAGFDSDVWPG